MRRATLNGSRAVLLAGPTVLAFFTGGYFDGPREVAGAVVWVLVAVAVVLVPRPLPCLPNSRIAVVGLALLAAWTVSSVTWAPVAGTAYHYGQRLVMYAGALLASVALLRGRAPLRMVVPALAGGALIVIGYGLSERLLPGVLHFSRSVSAEGRLEQPLTYWNAMGEVAALGFVLCTALAGDASRSSKLRAAAGAGAAPLGMGLYVTFSRGALFACAAGLVALIVLVPRREQLRAVVVSVATGVVAALVAAPFKEVTNLSGGSRELEGAVVLVLLVVIALAGAIAQARMARARDQAPRVLPLPRRAPMIALALICTGLALAIAVGAKEGSHSSLGAGPSRLASLQSNRYAYWRVALRAFGDEPLRGVGAGGWSVDWLRYRKIDEFAQDAHSLPLQTLAELGVIGFAFLLAFLGGAAWAARDALRVAPVLAGGPVAGLVTYLAHAPLDWDWEMPAVTLIALTLTGAVLGLAELARPAATGPRRSAAPRD